MPETASRKVIERHLDHVFWFYGQFFYTAVGRMNALQKVVKGKLANDGNDDFVIKDELCLRNAFAAAAISGK